MKKLKSEKGAITIIVLVSVLFFVSFLISSYVIVTNKVQMQKEIIEETQKIYEPKSSIEEIYSSYFITNEVIPIYTAEQLLAIGQENKQVNINGKFYTFTNKNTYILKNDLTIYEEELPENWIAPEYFFQEEQNTGKFNYNGNITKIIYENGTEKVYNGIAIAYLDISQGSIDIKNTGYVQGTLVDKGYAQTVIEGIEIKHKGKYVITGTSTENTIIVSTQGDFDITIKDLNIDMSNLPNYCAINANSSSNATGTNVKITLEGSNTLKGSGAALAFSTALPNIDGEKQGSTLIIEGSGTLNATGGGFSAAIGSGYGYRRSGNGDVSNIIINGGTIIANGGMHGSGIGASRYKSTNNIVINGGTIQAIGHKNYRSRYRSNYRNGKQYNNKWWKCFSNRKIFYWRRKFRRYYRSNNT